MPSAPTGGKPSAVASHRKVGLLPEVGPEVTTLVVFNIPWFYKMEELLEAWPPDGRYDYLNILYNFDARHNVGYGFINFTEHAHAVQFVERWHGRLLPKQKCGKRLQTVPARNQGLRENLARLSLRDLEEMAQARVSPIVFLGGERVDPLEASIRLGLIAEGEGEEGQAERAEQQPLLSKSQVKESMFAEPYCAKSAREMVPQFKPPGPEALLMPDPVDLPLPGFAFASQSSDHAV